MIRQSLISFSMSGRRAEVFQNPSGEYEVDFYKAGKYILSETYKGKSIWYHADAAENYVEGIKKI